MVKVEDPASYRGTPSAQDRRIEALQRRSDATQRDINDIKPLIEQLAASQRSLAKRKHDYEQPLMSGALQGETKRPKREYHHPAQLCHGIPHANDVIVRELVDHRGERQPQIWLGEVKV